MIDPVPVRATGTFVKRSVPACLRASFASIWVHKMPAKNAPPVIVTPDATIDLQWVDGRLRIAGPDKEPQTEIVRADEAVIGFRFQPAAAAAWLGVPMSELVGRRVPLEEVVGAGRARRIVAKVRVDDDLDELVRALENAVAAATPAVKTDSAMRAAYAMIEQSIPADAPLIPYLLRALSMSERSLRRRFDESFGYGPKTLDRILRYQRYSRLSRRAGRSASDLAAEAGYSDQAHLVRESRRLTGSTPGQLQRLLLA
jgi:AraC-like DNA-binding protein